MLSSSFEFAKITLGVLSIVFLLVMLPCWIFYSAYSNVALYMDAKDWQQCEAKILLAERTGPRTGARKVVKNHVWYQYEWDGQNFVSNQVDPSRSANIKWKDKLTPIKQLFPKDAKVPVFVDPDNPEQSLLNRDFTWGL